MKAMKFLTIFVLALTFATLSNSQTTSGPVNETTPDPSDEGSGTEPPESFTGITEGGSGDDSDATTEPSVVTTPDPCEEYCGQYQTCPDECGGCDEGLKLSLNNYCAKPCTQSEDVELIWCDGIGEVTTECTVNDDDAIVCGCMPDYYRNNDKVCTEAKVFGGIITFDETYDESDVAGMEINVQNALDAIYESDPGYVRSEVLNVTEGSIVATYNLIYELYSDATDKTIQESFNTATDGCNGSSSSVSGSVYTIDCSSKDTVIDSSVLCEKYAQTLNCDNVTARCDNIDGGTTCVCSNSEFYRKPYTSATFCTKLTCVANNDDFCNPPFGECVQDDNDQLNNFCQCTVFGWSGSQCEDPWEFVFTIVTAGLGLILIGVLTACICMSQKGKSVKKSQKQEELDLQNPFVDFQPGIVRAKVPSNMYSISDSYEAPNGGGQSHTNGAYNSAYDDGNARQTSTFAGAQGKPQKNDYEYF